LRLEKEKEEGGRRKEEEWKSGEGREKGLYPLHRQSVDTSLNLIMSDQNVITSVINADPVSNGDEDQPFVRLDKATKKALKRARSEELFAVKKKLKREQAKVKKRAKTAELRATEPPRPERAPLCDEAESKRRREEWLENQNTILLDRWALCTQNFACILDCAWEGSHSNDRDIQSLAQQLLFAHAINKKIDHPCELIVSGCEGSMKEKLLGLNADVWVGCRLREEDYLTVCGRKALLGDGPVPVTAATATVTTTAPSSSSPALPAVGTEENAETEGESAIALANKEARASNRATRVDNAVRYEDVGGRFSSRPVVYLTADSENVLTSVDPNAIYIIGGIVDRNHMKGETLTKATRDQISTARLPLQEYLPSYRGCKALTVLHVYEILVRQRVRELEAAVTVIEEKEEEKEDLWTLTLKEVLPSRKQSCDYGVVSKKDRRAAKAKIRLEQEQELEQGQEEE